MATTLVLTAEGMKLFLTFIFLTLRVTCSFGQTFRLLHEEVFGRPKDTGQLAVPAFLYIIQDNLVIFSLSCLDAATFQVNNLL